jgi:hypothetical protein
MPPPAAVAALSTCRNTFVSNWRLTELGYLMMLGPQPDMSSVCLSVDSWSVYETVCREPGSCTCTTFKVGGGVFGCVCFGGGG